MDEGCLETLGYPMIISETPSEIWNFNNYMDKRINRSEITVSQYLATSGIDWSISDRADADFRVYKEENIRNGLLSLRRLKNEYQKKILHYPYMNIIGEAQEYARCAYLLADPKRTLAVAPGTKFQRAYFPVEWEDPQLDTWEDRQDRICLIGRPLPNRLYMVRILRNLQIPFDVYGKGRWAIREYKGSVPDERETSRTYKYRIVMENSYNDQYHSEKLINSIMSGCVTFYGADPALKTSLDSACLSLDEIALRNREIISGKCLNKIKEVLYSNQWETYSFKAFFDRIITEARRQVI